MRILAIDYGRKRIGLAVSDPLGIMAHPLETLIRQSPRKDIEALAAIAAEKEAALLLVGNPIHLSGEPSEMSSEATAFAGRLSERCGIPFLMWDERLTSREAGHLLRETGRTAQRDGSVDQVAAQILLNHYLSTQ
jgi:putative Holliday junction resolvase